MEYLAFFFVPLTLFFFFFIKALQINFSEIKSTIPFMGQWGLQFIYFLLSLNFYWATIGGLYAIIDAGGLPETFKTSVVNILGREGYIFCWLISIYILLGNILLFKYALKEVTRVGKI